MILTPSVLRTGSPPGTGVVTLHDVDPAGGPWRPRSVTRNTWMYTWGFLAAKVLGEGDPDYKIGAAYLEFENVAHPADPVAVPPFVRQDGIDYYDTLAGLGNRDILRLPLVVTPAIAAAAGFEQLLPSGQGNQLTFFVQTAGTTGVFGTPFSDTVNSKVCGVALVATPARGDRTRDILFSRAYYAGPDQVLKTPNGQVGIQYALTFG